jgi:hypothetical protein
MDFVFQRAMRTWRDWDLQVHIELVFNLGNGQLGLYSFQRTKREGSEKIPTSLIIAKAEHRKRKTFLSPSILDNFAVLPVTIVF